MFYFRAVRNHSAFKSASFDQAKAAADLTDRSGGLTSVFCVTGDADGKNTAVLYAMSFSQWPNPFDYVLIPEPWLSECSIRAEPAVDNKLPHPKLQTTHCELHGVNSTRCALLAQKFADSPDAIADRITKSQLIDMARAAIDADNSGLTKSLIEGKEQWLHRIAKTHGQ